MRRQRGFALIIASLALLVVASVALLLVTESSMGQRLLASDAERAELEYLAEAGFAHARWQLARNTTCTSYAPVPATIFEGHSYNASFSPTAGSPVSITLTGKHAGGVVRTFDQQFINAYQAPAMRVLQPDAVDGEDAYIWKFHPSWNYGWDDETWVSFGGSNSSRSLLKFDVSVIPAGAKILDATLSLHHRSGNDADVPITAHRITNVWNENFVTWNDRDDDTPWDTVGGDFDPTAISTTSVGPASFRRYEWDITGLVQGWTDGALPNYGVALATSMNGATGERFDTSDHPDPTRRPSLTIAYACECGLSCGPGSSGDLLMVVPDPSNLSTQLQEKKALIESWGYVINLIDESDTLVNYDAAFAANDVVYVPQEINSGNLGTKLFTAPIGVVNEEGELVDELGIAQDKIFKSRDEIDIVDNTHYITELFPTGLLTYLSSQQSVHMLSGTQAAGLQTLGESLNTGSIWKPSLAVLEVDSVLYGGGNAAGRRVQLPWGGGTFDVDELNDDGRTIMRRAIEWGAIDGSTVLGPFAHWKLDETSGTTAVDSVGGHDGTLVNFPATPTWVPGQLDGGLSFDGGNDYIDVSSMNPMSYDDFTIIAWYRSADTSVSDDEYVFVHDDSFVDELTFGATDDVSDRLRLGINRGGTWDPHYGTSDIVDQQWHHLAAVRAGGRIKLYVDGIKETDEPDALAGLTLTIDGDGPFIGDYPGVTEQVHGTLDDVRLYDRGLSDAEIAELAAAANTGPIAHWKLDDGTGTTAVDSAGGHDGTLLNWPATPTWVPGLLDGGLSFDGSNDRVDVGTFDVAGNGLTLMGWFYADALPDTTDPRLVSKASSTAEADAWWQLSILTNAGSANIRFRTKAGGTTSTLIDSGTDLNTGEWYFAVGTYDAGSGEMKLYLNGIEVASQTHPVAGPVSTNGSVPVALGANGSPEQFFDGVLDDLRIYDRALRASEIADLYAAGGGGGGGGPTLFEVRVATGNDDAEERVSTGSVNLTSTDLELISDGSNAQLVGMRFTNVTVPSGATVSSAYVQFQVDETNTGATSLTIQGQAIDDAPTFTSASTNISSRSRSTASASWTPVAWNTVGEAGPDQRTPDIKSVIQEIVDRPGWTSGSDIVIIFTGSGERTAESYNGSASAAPLLHIEY